MHARPTFLISLAIFIVVW